MGLLIKFSLLFNLIPFLLIAQQTDSLVIKLCQNEYESPEGTPLDFTREISAYDNLGNLLYVTHQEWNLGQANHHVLDSTIYDYDGNQRVIFIYYYGTNPPVSYTIGPAYKKYYTYDSLDRVVNLRQENWSATLQNWYTKADIYYSYSITGSVDSVWNINIPIPTAESSHFDSVLNLQTYMTWQWDSTSWQANTRHRWWKNGQSFDTLNILDNWDGTDWINISKSSIQYDTSNHLTLQVNSNGQGNNWINHNQIICSYDTAGRLIYSRTDYWIDSTSTWSPNSYFAYSYGFSPRTKLTYFILWNTNAGMWDSTWWSRDNLDSLNRVTSTYTYYYWDNHGESSGTVYDQFGNVIYNHASGAGYEGYYRAIYNSDNQILHTESSHFSAHSTSTSSECDWYRIKPDSIVVSIPDSLDLCPGGSNNISGLIIYPDSPVSIQWSPSSGVSNDTILAPIFSPVTTTTYQLALTDTGGNIATTPFTVTIHPFPPPPFLDSLVPPGRCFPDTIIYFVQQPSLGYYQWRSTGNIYPVDNDSLFYSKIYNTDYYFLLGFSEFGCMSSSDTFQVSLQSPPVTYISTSPTFYCLGDTTTLSVNLRPNNTYQWKINGVDTTGTTDSTFKITQNGLYEIYVIDTINGCDWSNVYDARFGTPNLPTTILVDPDTIICANQSVQIYSAFTDTAWTYSWYYNGSNLYYQSSTDSFSVSQGGYYWLTVHDANCKSTADTVFIYYDSFHPLLTPSGMVWICSPDSLLLQVTPGQQYLWSTGETTAQITVDTAAFYSCIVTDSFGCTGSNTMKLNVNIPGPASMITWIFPELVSSVTGNLQWYRNDSMITGATGLSYQPLIDGTYQVSYIDSNSCEVFSAGYYFSLLGLAPLTNKSLLSIYPNPFLDNATFVYLGNGRIEFVDIFDSKFKLVLSLQEPGRSFVLPTSDLASGFYYCRVKIFTSLHMDDQWLKLSKMD